MLTAGSMRTLFNFISLHEYTHHVLGHLDGSSCRAEFAYGSGRLEGYKRQPQEIVADGYAAYYALENLFNSAERQHIISMLTIEALTNEQQDAIIFVCLVASVVGFMFSSPPEDPELNVFEHEHPLTMARLSFFAERCRVWCQQSREPLEGLFASGRVTLLMRTVAQTILDPTNADGWQEQELYLLSPDGIEYKAILHKSVVAEVAIRS
jgi:hypothetical protein